MPSCDQDPSNEVLMSIEVYRGMLVGVWRVVCEGWCDCLLHEVIFCCILSLSGFIPCLKMVTCCFSNKTGNQCLLSSSIAH